MRRSILAFAIAIMAGPAALNAQTAPAAQAPLRDQLMPAGNAVLAITPAPVATAAEKAAEDKIAEEKPNQPVMAARGSGVGYMIAGLALFVAGLIIDDDDAGTVLILAGAGIGAYGLYLHFR